MTKRFFTEYFIIIITKCFQLVNSLSLIILVQYKKIYIFIKYLDADPNTISK